MVTIYGSPCHSNRGVGIDLQVPSRIQRDFMVDDVFSVFLDGEGAVLQWMLFGDELGRHRQSDGIVDPVKVNSGVTILLCVHHGSMRWTVQDAVRKSLKQVQVSVAIDR